MPDIHATDVVQEQLTSLLIGKFDVPAEEAVPQATLGDLDLDSLARVELFVTLEEHWDIVLGQDGGEDAAAGLTVAELVHRITELTRARLAESGHVADSNQVSEPGHEPSRPGSST